LTFQVYAQRIRTKTHRDEVRRVENNRSGDGELPASRSSDVKAPSGRIDLGTSGVNLDAALERNRD
jgi:hypothetical protein